MLLERGDLSPLCGKYIIHRELTTKNGIISCLNLLPSLGEANLPLAILKENHPLMKKNIGICNCSIILNAMQESMPRIHIPITCPITTRNIAMPLSMSKSAILFLVFICFLDFDD